MATRVRAVRGARKMRAFAKKGALRTAATPAEWNELLNSVPGLLVVEFTAPWSAPCKAMAPYLGLLASQPEYSTVVFARVDVEASPELGARLGVTAAPSYHFYRDGIMLDNFAGAMPPKLLEFLTKYKAETAASSGRKGGWSLLAFAAAGVALVTYLLLNRGPPPEEPGAEKEKEKPPPPPPPAPASRRGPRRKRPVPPTKGARGAAPTAEGAA